MSVMKFSLKSLFLTFLLFFMLPAFAENFSYETNAKTISAKVTSEKGKKYFYCRNNRKCSTEDVVNEYYEKKGYKVIKAGLPFWQTMFGYGYFEEIFSGNMNSINDLPLDFFKGRSFYESRKLIIDKKYKYLLSANLKTFINQQITEYSDYKCRILSNDAPDTTYIKSSYFSKPLFQSFLAHVDNKMFAKITYRIAQNPSNNRAGLPDFVVWNEKEMKLVEAKRENEKISPKQLAWLNFFIDNNIPFEVIYVSSRK